MTGSALLLAAVLLPLAAAAAAPALGDRLGARAGWLLALSFAPGLALAGYAPRALRGEPLTANLAWVPGLGLDLAFRADGFSLLFALLVAGIGLLVAFYSGAYLAADERHGRFYTYLLLFGGSMLGLVLTDNLIALFAFWELTSISSYLLIGFWDSRAASRDGALKALLVTAFGGLALLVAVILLGMAGGTLAISQLDAEALRAGALFPAAVTLLLVAAFTKSAQLPFHLWLPTAMEAPTPVSAYLHSATMVKAGVFLVAKFGFLLTGTPFGDLALYVGLATMFWGSYLALRQTDLKALLAYSTVSQLGLLTALYGAGDAFAGTAHLVNHAAFKAALFLVVGIIDHQAGTRDLTRLSGLWRKLPVTAALAVVAAASMAGLPPLGGFISKELFLGEMLAAGFLPVLVAVAGSVMTFAYSIRFLRVFFGPESEAAAAVRPAPATLWLPALPLGAAALLFGVLPGTAAALANLAAPALGYRPGSLALWHGPNVVLALTVLTWFFGAALLVVLPQFRRAQAALTPGWNANTVYYGLLAGLLRGAQGLTGVTQGATFASHLRLIFLPVALVGAYLGWQYLPARVTAVPAPILVVAVLAVTGAVGVLVARTRLTLLIFLSLAGFGSTLAFLLLRAPDLALTQLLIERFDGHLLHSVP